MELAQGRLRAFPYDDGKMARRWWKSQKETFLQPQIAGLGITEPNKSQNLSTQNFGFPSMSNRLQHRQRLFYVSLQHGPSTLAVELPPPHRYSCHHCLEMGRRVS